MLDTILKQGIQRWENEGGLLYPAQRNNNLEIIARNNSFRSWNDSGRNALERAHAPHQTPFDHVKSVNSLNWHEASECCA
jgi:hypothetical protein